MQFRAHSSLYMCVCVCVCVCVCIYIYIYIYVETEIYISVFYIVTYQGSPVTRQLNGASLLYFLISATVKTNAS
jgi:hypothetical protein